MKWLSRLELKYGRFAVRNLTFYLIGLNIGVFILSSLLLGGTNQHNPFEFVLSDILKGQLWRVFTFVFLPDSSNPIYIFLEMYLLYFIGTSLESYWGRFKFNVYYFFGMLGTILAAFIIGYGSTGLFINLSLFLAFATLFPDRELMIFFVLPVKAKFLGLLDAFYILYLLVMSLRFGQWSVVAAIIASLANYLLFFSGDIINWIKLRKQVHNNRRRFFDQVRPFDRNRK